MVFVRDKRYGETVGKADRSGGESKSRGIKAAIPATQ